MKADWRFIGALLLLATAAAHGQAKSDGDAKKTPLVEVRSGIAHGPWGGLLKKYVDDNGRIDYAAWKASAADSEGLRDYLRLFAAEAEPPAQGNERIASLINAYNALAVEWILSHYPTPSIRSLDHSFTNARHEIAGKRVSLDDIEHRTLRPLAGYRIHAALSCASRSCPPLAREPFEAARLEAQLTDRMRTWLANEDLNRFLPAEGKAKISEVFRWNLEDFQRAGGVKNILREYAPRRFTAFLSTDSYTIEYLPYQWGLNDQGAEGRNYGGAQLVLDKLRHGQ